MGDVGHLVTVISFWVSLHHCLGCVFQGYFNSGIQIWRWNQNASKIQKQNEADMRQDCLSVLVVHTFNPTQWRQMLAVLCEFNVNLIYTAFMSARDTQLDLGFKTKLSSKDSVSSSIVHNVAQGRCVHCDLSIYQSILSS